MHDLIEMEDSVLSSQTGTRNNGGVIAEGPSAATVNDSVAGQATTCVPPTLGTTADHRPTIPNNAARGYNVSTVARQANARA